MQKRKILLPILLALLACGKPPPPEEPLDRLYRSLGETREDHDLSALRGKRILIDPGHGGRFSGTVGIQGLAEKDVNLGVALYLWGLLRDAGADVHLTRSSDRDFLAGAGDGDEGLESDLDARLAIADSLMPKLFVSIHHNAAADTNRSRNRIEMYYRPGDAGPSLDAARSIYLHLARNLGVPEGGVLPGNFRVLRASRFPAVLGEPSYLSHPPVEEKLVLAEKRRLEAEAYFLGILDYFERGVPEARIDEPAGEVGEEGRLRLAGEVRDEAGRSGIDPSSVRASLDGAPLPVRYDAATGRVNGPLPADLSAGKHLVSLTARNLGGNAAQASEKAFFVRFPPARLFAEGVRLPGGAGALLLLHLLDERALPVADETGFEAALDPPGDEWLKGETTGGRALLSTAAFASAERVRVRTDDIVLEAPFDGAGIEEPACVLFVVGEAGRPVEEAELWRNGEWAGSARPGGWIPLGSIPKPDEILLVEAPGVAPVPIDSDRLADRIDTLRLGAGERAPLAGKRIFLDPEGTRRGGPFSPDRESMAAALYLQEMLRSAGADAPLSREEDALPSLDRRISAGVDLRPDFWVSISIGDSLAVRHFPGSAEGAPAARAVADALRDRLGIEVPVESRTDRVLRETPCPAIRVLFPVGEVEAREGSGRLRAVAHAVAEALLARLDRSAATRAVLTIRAGRPGGLVRIDDSCTYQAIGGDSVVVRGLIAGTHRVRAEGSEGWWERTVRLAPGGSALVP
jgi:N-acetylmuramoyl-L-alanine amidase